MITTAFENYSDLDSLGRCGVAYANICKDIMPTEAVSYTHLDVYKRQVQ